MLNFLLCFGTILSLSSSEGLVCFSYANNTRSIEKCSPNTTECYSCPSNSLYEQPQGGCHPNPLMPSSKSSHNPKFNNGQCSTCKWDLCNSVAMIVEPVDTGRKVERPPTSYWGYYIAGGILIVVIATGCFFGMRHFWPKLPCTQKSSATDGNDHEMSRLAPVVNSECDPPADQNGTTSP
uniref:TNFR-Cys domain-containing protein n=1 Tax=Panagrellus redivivus TaxID=6233 RepID=A0A7E4W335_PANRE